MNRSSCFTGPFDIPGFLFEESVPMASLGNRLNEWGSTSWLRPSILWAGPAGSAVRAPPRVAAAGTPPLAAASACQVSCEAREGRPRAAPWEMTGADFPEAAHARHSSARKGEATAETFQPNSLPATELPPPPTHRPLSGLALRDCLWRPSLDHCLGRPELSRVSSRWQSSCRFKAISLAF